MSSLLRQIMLPATARPAHRPRVTVMQPAGRAGLRSTIPGGFATLIRYSRFPGNVRTLAFAGVIATGLAARRQPLIRGMNEDTFRQLLRSCFPGVNLDNGTLPAGQSGTGLDIDEYDDLLDMLLDHRVEKTALNDWVARCVATAAMDNNHLWQDMGLPDRGTLSRLLTEIFPTLALRNSGDMKWKKFFYRQLCERSGINVCKSPNCAVCVDHAVCFGPEDGKAAHMVVEVV